MAETTTAPPAEAKVGLGTKLKNLGSRIGTKIDSLGKPIIPLHFEESPAEQARIAEQTASKNQRIADRIAEDKKNAADARDLINAYNEGNLQFLSGKHAHEAAVRVLTSATEKVNIPESPEKLALARDMLGKTSRVERNVKWDRRELAEEKAADERWRKEREEADRLATLEHKKPVRKTPTTQQELIYQRIIERDLENSDNFRPENLRDFVEDTFHLQGQESHQNWTELVNQARDLARTGLNYHDFKEALDSKDPYEKKAAQQLFNLRPDIKGHEILNFPEFQEWFRDRAGISVDEVTQSEQLRQASRVASRALDDLQRKLQEGDDISIEDFRGALIAKNRAVSADYSYYKDHIVTKVAAYWQRVARLKNIRIENSKLIPNIVDLDPQYGSLKEQLPKVLWNKDSATLQIPPEMLAKYLETIEFPVRMPGLFDFNLKLGKIDYRALPSGRLLIAATFGRNIIPQGFVGNRFTTTLREGPSGLIIENPDPSYDTNPALPENFQDSGAAKERDIATRLNEIIAEEINKQVSGKDFIKIAGQEFEAQGLTLVEDGKLQVDFNKKTA